MSTPIKDDLMALLDSQDANGGFSDEGFARLGQLVEAIRAAPPWPEPTRTLERIEGLLLFLFPKYQQEGKHQVTLAIGCTGGQHRSTAIADRISKDLRRAGYVVTVQHRDIEREQRRVAAI